MYLSKCKVSIFYVIQYNINSKRLWKVKDACIYRRATKKKMKKRYR